MQPLGVRAIQASYLWNGARTGFVFRDLKEIENIACSHSYY